MKTIKQHYLRIKMNFCREVAAGCLNKAHAHMKDEVCFWKWMRLFRKYSNKYFELIQKVEL